MLSKIFLSSEQTKKNIDLITPYYSWPCFSIENLHLVVTNLGECSLLTIHITQVPILDLVFLNIC